MKNLIALLLALTFAGGAYAQTILRNSITTNDLSTNLVWTPGSKILNIRGNSPELDFWNTAGALNLKRYSISDSSGQFRFHWTDDAGGSSLLLGYFDSLGDFNVTGYLSLSGQTNRLTIVGGKLLLDGVEIGSNTTTNTYNTIIATNITVLNSLTVSNISVTNVTVQNNLTVSNLYTVNGAHNTLIITNALTLQTIKTNLLATDASGTVTNAVYGTGIAWDPTTRTISATSSGSGVTTTVTPLAYSGTNITGFNCLTNNATYTLVLTNHCLFDSSTFTGLPNTTTNMFFTLGLQENSAGGWVPKFTNSIITWASGVQPVVPTNANAVTYLYFHTGLFTNGTLVGSVNPDVR